VDATESGLLLIPFMIATAFATMVAGRRVERTGRYRAWPIVGGVVMTAGVLALTTIGLDTDVAVVAALGAVVGVGIGFAMQTSLLAVQNGVDPADLGMGTSTALLSRTLGGTIGTPLFGAVLAAGLPAHHATAADFADALPWVFVVAVPIGVLAVLFGLMLADHPLCEATPFDLDQVIDPRPGGQPGVPWRPEPPAKRAAPANASPDRNTPIP
jgi:MFS family permease